MSTSTAKTRTALSLIFLTSLLPSLALAQAADQASAQKEASAKSAPAKSSQWTPDIPKTWDEEALEALQVPLTVASASPTNVPAELYDQLIERTIYKSYPIYHPDKEPEGYWERLNALEPEIAFDASKLETKDDWIAAGEIVFEAPISNRGLTPVPKVRDASWWEEFDIPMATDGTMPFNRYVIEAKGKISVGEFSCATCHTRVLPDGRVVKGAQGNIPLGALDGQIKKESIARMKDMDPAMLKQRARMSFERTYGMPWLDPNPLDPVHAMSFDQVAALEGSIPPGVQARFATSILYPVQVSDLIGIKDRKYLDHTGHFRHNSIGDLMRYAALNQGLERLQSYGEHNPGGRPAPTSPPRGMRRYTDEQLYALALYLYALEPPENPNAFDELAARGKVIFEREECAKCHRPPLYTNNMLTPADGYVVAADHPDRESVIPTSVGTDPSLTMKTRRGTGFYKVPSLKGVWYRGPLSHGGWVATLEDWFDPGRLGADYVPTGFKGYTGEPGPVQGHRFGLNLPEKERKALIAFLRTL